MEVFEDEYIITLFHAEKQEQRAYRLMVNQ